MRNRLSLNLIPSATACNAGLFISQGQGTHPERIIDTHELIFVRTGTLCMHQGTRRFSIRPGQALLLRKGIRHGGTAPFPPDLSFYWIHFRLNPIPKTSRPPYGIHLSALTTVSRPDRLTEIFRHFLDDQETGRLTPVTADLMMMLLLSEVADTRPPPDASLNETTASLAHRAEQYIGLHANEPISTQAIATALRCNADYLGRIFQKSYGHTLTDAIHKQRHHKARSLLMDSTLSIKEIAQTCGFDDVGYFRRLFKRQTGLSPLAFRGLYAHLHVNKE
ncbi:MAG: AraC family transcriptional regulator [bacterium]